MSCKVDDAWNKMNYQHVNNMVRLGIVEVPRVDEEGEPPDWARNLYAKRLLFDIHQRGDYRKGEEFMVVDVWRGGTLYLCVYRGDDKRTDEEFRAACEDLITTYITTAPVRPPPMPDEECVAVK